MKIGYARVSRQDQNLERQIEALEKEGCEHMFAEKISGGIRSRVELDKLLEIIKPGDTLVVQKLDRLGRSFMHLMEILERFVNEGIGLKSLGDNLDTHTPTGKAVIRIMSVIAELEREMISDRTKDALQSAKRRGKILGAPKKNYEEDLKKFSECIGTREEVMKQMGISQFKYYTLKNMQ